MEPATISAKPGRDDQARRLHRPAQARRQGKGHREAIRQADDKVLEHGRAGQVLLVVVVDGGHGGIEDNDCGWCHDFSVVAPLNCQAANLSSGNRVTD